MAELPLVEMLPLLKTVLPGPSVEMPCELPPVVEMLPLLVMSVRVLLFDVTRMPEVPLLVVRTVPLLVMVLSLPVATIAARAEPEPPETVMVPLFVMVLASRTSSACVALVVSVAPLSTVIATPVLPGAAITLAEPVVAPLQTTVSPVPGVAVGSQAAFAAPPASPARAAASHGRGGIVKAELRRRDLSRCSRRMARAPSCCSQGRGPGAAHYSGHSAMRKQTNFRITGSDRMPAQRRTMYRVTTGPDSPMWKASLRSRSAMSLAVARVKRRRWSVHDSSTICST